MHSVFASFLPKEVIRMHYYKCKEIIFILDVDQSRRTSKVSEVLEVVPTLLSAQKHKPYSYAIYLNTLYCLKTTGICSKRKNSAYLIRPL